MFAVLLVEGVQFIPILSPIAVPVDTDDTLGLANLVPPFHPIRVILYHFSTRSVKSFNSSEEFAINQLFIKSSY